MNDKVKEALEMLYGCASDRYTKSAERYIKVITQHIEELESEIEELESELDNGDIVITDFEFSGGDVS